MCNKWSTQILHIVQLPQVEFKCTMCNMNLSRIRKAQGLSLADLGDKIGKDASTVHRAEKMDKTAKLETYQLCAQALGVTLKDIFCDELEPIERELVAAFRAVKEDQRSVFVGLIAMAKDRAQSSNPEGIQVPEETKNE